MEIKINREIREYTEAMYFGLSLRQFICAVLLGHNSIHTTYEYYCEVMDEKDKIIAFMNDTFVPERTGTEG